MKTVALRFRHANPILKKEVPFAKAARHKFCRVRTFLNTVHLSRYFCASCRTYVFTRCRQQVFVPETAFQWHARAEVARVDHNRGARTGLATVLGRIASPRALPQAAIARPIARAPLLPRRKVTIHRTCLRLAVLDILKGLLGTCFYRPVFQSDGPRPRACSDSAGARARSPTRPVCNQALVAIRFVRAVFTLLNAVAELLS